MHKAGKKQVEETQWYLFRRKFKRHKLARVALKVIALLFLVGVLLPGFFSPYSVKHRFDNEYLPPQRPHFIDAEGGFHLFPFVYKTTQVLDEDTWQYTNINDTCPMISSPNNGLSHHRCLTSAFIISYLYIN